MARSEKTKIKKISVLNWIGTLLLCSIPAVNLVALILFVIFSKNPSKRSFAIAGLLLTLLFVALICAAFLLFPMQLSEFAAYLRGGDAVHLLIEPSN